jgi:DNA-binding MarR family transcriptional regulator
MRERDAIHDSIVRRVARECFALRVQLLNRVVTRLYDDALRPLGLTLNQMSILTVLANVPSAQPGDIGELLQMEKSTVSRNVKRMRRQKWVREGPGADGRRVVLTLTDTGRALLARAVPLWERAQAAARELLGGDGAGVASISELVDRFVAPRKKP